MAIDFLTYFLWDMYGGLRELAVTAVLDIQKRNLRFYGVYR